MAGRTDENRALQLRESGVNSPKLPKIVGIAVPFPGAKRPLEEGAKLGFWEFVEITEGNVRIPRADIYILAAWHPIYERLLSLGRVGVLWTSSAGEMDFEPVEQRYLASILQDTRIEFVWFGDPSLASLYSQKGFHAPYPMMLGVSEGGADKSDVITLFCPTTQKKNIFNQLLGVYIFQRTGGKATLHSNVRGYDDVFDLLRVERHHWLPDAEYRALIQSAKVNLACSWAETFNYNVAEAGMLGTPSIISSTVPLPGHVVRNPNSPNDIAVALHRCLEDAPPLFTHIRQDMHRKAIENNEACLRRISDYLASSCSL